MRIFVLLFVFTVPALGACSVAYAKAPADISKPVCMRYDDNASTTARAATVASASIASASTPVVATNAPSTTVKTADTPAHASAHPASAAVAQTRGGGASDVGHSQTAPHWQTFLPGMFR